MAWLPAIILDQLYWFFYFWLLFLLFISISNSNLLVKTKWHRMTAMQIHVKCWLITEILIQKWKVGQQLQETNSHLASGAERLDKPTMYDNSEEFRATFQHNETWRDHIAEMGFPCYICTHSRDKILWALGWRLLWYL